MSINWRRLSCLCAAAVLNSVISMSAAAIPTIQHWQTENGVRVYFIQTQALPMLDIQLVFAAGSARDGGAAGLPGLAALTNSQLLSGAGDMNADAIAIALASVGAELSTDSLRDMALLRLRSLTDPEKLNQALAVFQQVVNQPTFPIADLERDRQRILLAIKNKQLNPGAVLTDAFFAALYREHPYATPPEGTTASVHAITREHILAFYRRYYVASNAVIALVGDVDRQQAERIIEQLVGSLPRGVAAPAIAAPAMLTEASEQRIELPTSQTHIAVGQLGVKRGDPDFFPLYVGNHILGGSGFASRLMQEIREDRGLAYSVFSYFSPMAVAGPFRAGLQTRNQQAEAALALLRENIARFVTAGPTPAELEQSIKNITGGFPLKIDSNADLLGYLGMLGFYGLPLDYLQTFNARVQAVTVENIREAWQRRIQPDKMAVILVGQQNPED